MTVPTVLYLLVSLGAIAFVGSWHCGLMCGPMACGFLRKGNIAYYHMGRCVSYIGGGILFGHLGKTIFAVHSYPARVAVALLLSLFFVVPQLSTAWIPQRLHNKIFRALQMNNGLFVFGLLSALLPCGWLWTFYAGAAASASPLTGALVMFVLWISSLPALSALPLLFKSNLKQINARRARVAHAVLSLAGIYAVWSHLFL